MKLELKKTSLVNLSVDLQVLPAELTPQVAGARASSVYTETNLPTSVTCTLDNDDLRP
jgi:hypothetical protein